MTGLLQYIFSGIVPFLGTLFLLICITIAVCLVLVSWGEARSKQRSIKIEGPNWMNEWMNGLLDILKEYESRR